VQHCVLRAEICFYSHTHEGRVFRRRAISPAVSTLTPAKGASAVTVVRYVHRLFLLSRPRRARLTEIKHRRFHALVSTLTPAKGASAVTVVRYVHRLFLLSRPRRAHRHCQSMRRSEACFYSRAREGRVCTSGNLARHGTSFYSHAREGRIRIIFGLFSGGRGFYSHAREGRIEMVACARTSVRTFLLSRPRRAHHRRWSGMEAQGMFLLSRPRRARPRRCSSTGAG